MEAKPLNNARLTLRDYPSRTVKKLNNGDKKNKLKLEEYLYRKNGTDVFYDLKQMDFEKTLPSNKRISLQYQNGQKYANYMQPE
ncbi:hypothetical protein [Mucilaginibacter aquariorum]|uniref:Uncharacterized protein n=1 Tax=Mucilaginibacter aquariorum TaxID=2967225 RepID=A0ABT1T9X4_9SPHI|nr:hypothetical protein [Mucilaginibacter aquariorum]MCQ6960758.1 hypothetical protein [Mucilaginibacter aquariorum]